MFVSLENFVLVPKNLIAMLRTNSALTESGLKCVFSGTLKDALLAHRKVFHQHSERCLLKGGHRQLSSTFSEAPPCSSLQWPTYRNQLSVENHNIENLKMASSRNIEVYYKCFKSSTNQGLLGLRPLDPSAYGA